MKRIHLFEFEDFSWFPNWLRVRMTRYIITMHKLLGTRTEIAGLVAKGLKHSEKPKIIDLCSGSGGPMLEVLETMKNEHGLKDLKLTLSDLYPNPEAAKRINEDGDASTSYLTSPVNATQISGEIKGLRTMICSMHHMKPEVAHNILKDAKEANQPICVFEMSDNSIPIWLSWIAFPINIIMVLLLTPLVRPMSWQQIVFTYLIPILPILIAWDGAVSNARTYTLKDMDQLLEGLRSDDYTWETGIIKGKAKKIYLLGLPKI